MQAEGPEKKSDRWTRPATMQAVRPEGEPGIHPGPSRESR
jgi:hypothetical protein